MTHCLAPNTVARNSFHELRRESLPFAMDPMNGSSVHFPCEAEKNPQQQKKKTINSRILFTTGTNQTTMLSAKSTTPCFAWKWMKRECRLAMSRTRETIQAYESAARSLFSSTSLGSNGARVSRAAILSILAV